MLMLNLRAPLRLLRVAMPTELQVSSCCEGFNLPQPEWFDAWLKIICELTNLDNGSEVAVRICGAEESCLLNSRYRDIKKPTNVLSFPSEITLNNFAHILGDIVICWDLLISEANNQNKRLLDHASHLFVHGLLHLLGYSHDDDETARQMEAIEVKALALKGINNPYE